MTDTETGGGEAERNPCSAGFQPASGRRRRDLNRTIEVLELAGEIARGDARRATLVSVEETRAIAKLAFASGLVAAAAVVLFEASDMDAPPEVIRELTKGLAEAVRPFMGQS